MSKVNGLACGARLVPRAEVALASRLRSTSYSVGRRHCTLSHICLPAVSCDLPVRGLGDDVRNPVVHPRPLVGSAYEIPFVLSRH
jgi:hypothetical protein